MTKRRLADVARRMSVENNNLNLQVQGVEEETTPMLSNEKRSEIAYKNWRFAINKLKAVFDRNTATELFKNVMFSDGGLNKKEIADRNA